DDAAPGCVLGFAGGDVHDRVHGVPVIDRLEIADLVVAVVQAVGEVETDLVGEKGIAHAQHQNALGAGPFEHRMVLAVFGIRVVRVVVAGGADEQADIGIGDRAPAAGVFGADHQVLKVQLFHFILRRVTGWDQRLPAWRIRPSIFSASTFLASLSCRGRDRSIQGPLSISLILIPSALSFSMYLADMSMSNCCSRRLAAWPASSTIFLRSSGSFFHARLLTMNRPVAIMWSVSV